MPLAALVVTEGSGNLYLTKVAVGGPTGTAGVDATVIADAGVATTGVGATAGAGAGATAGAGAGATTGVGATAGAKCLKIIRLFRILINPRSNVINPFNISLVDDIYDSTKS
jgi:hypothetical protein